MMKYAHVTGWGSYLPSRVVTNDQIAEMVDTSDDWIYTRTGIRTRRVAHPKETTATLAFEAAARAIAVAKLSPFHIDLIIVATSTPDYMFPSTASLVQSMLGATNAGAFDLSAACTGFVYGVQMASQAIATGSIKNALVIGAETMSRVLDWQDRETCILFGDGAGAIVLQGSSIPGGVLAAVLRSDGSGSNLLSLPQVYHNPVPPLGPDFIPHGAHKNVVEMEGRQVFRFATRVVPEVIKEVVQKANLTLDDIALIVPHQANARIIESAAKKLHVEPERFFMNVTKVGNTSAASIPIALCEAVEQRRLKPDDNVVFVGFGGGLAWGAVAIKWNVSPPEEQPYLEQWQRMRYVQARVSAQMRRWGRQLGARFGGSPTPDATLRDAERKRQEEQKRKGGE
jgi:3-oxoacyl-[acyl-carrier-protein] synthase III